MKALLPKTLLIILLGAGFWFGWRAWQVHSGLVSLHVRNAPITTVLQQLQKQTWKTIVADVQLDTPITLDLDSVPLREALSRVAEQAGAVMTTVHAIYRSNAAYDHLMTALRNGDPLRAHDWTNLAPNLEMAMQRPFGVDGGSSNSGDFLQKRTLAVDEEIVNRAEPGGLKTGEPPRVMRFVMTGSDGETIEESIVPERLMLETALQPLLDQTEHLYPAPFSAEATAKRTKAKFRTIFALKKSAAVEFGMPVVRHFDSRASNPDKPNTANKIQGNVPPSLETAEAAAQHAPLNRYRNLTPEQRAQRNREGRLSQP